MFFVADRHFHNLKGFKIFNIWGTLLVARPEKRRSGGENEKAHEQRTVPELVLAECVWRVDSAAELHYFPTGACRAR